MAYKLLPTTPCNLQWASGLDKGTLRRFHATELRFCIAHRIPTIKAGGADNNTGHDNHDNQLHSRVTSLTMLGATRLSLCSS
jgi:hypothetical protein